MHRKRAHSLGPLVDAHLIYLTCARSPPARSPPASTVTVRPQRGPSWTGPRCGIEKGRYLNPFRIVSAEGRG